MKKIDVTISVCLSSTQEVKVPDDYEYDPVTLESYVKEQIDLPQDILFTNGYEEWLIDDFCVL